MPPLPTDAELAILNVLWSKGLATVREVHEALDKHDIGYTTVLKTMQIMLGKGLIARDESNKTHVYRPAVKEEPTQRRLLGDLIDRAFQGSAMRLAMRALSVARASAEEIAEVRAYLDEIEKKSRRS